MAFRPPPYDSTTEALAYCILQALDTTLMPLPENQIPAPPFRSTLNELLYEIWQNLAGGGGSADLSFNGNRPITRQGLPMTGQVMGGETILEFTENTFFPALSESAILIAPNAIRRKGSDTAVALQWQAIRGTNPIVSIVVAGEAMVPTGNTQNGTKNVNTLPNTNTIYTMEVSDGQSPRQASVSINYMSDRFWGALGDDGLGNPATDLADFLANPPTDAQIRALSNELSNTLVQNRNGINGAGQFLAFHWPTSFGEPVFLINGLPNSAYTKVRDNVDFTNADGYTEKGDLWMSNTAQNSPIATFQINRAP